MNFPMQYPIFQFFYQLVNTGGVGGLIIALEGIALVGGYGLMLRWIAAGAKEPERETHLFPPHELHEG